MAQGMAQNLSEAIVRNDKQALINLVGCSNKRILLQRDASLNTALHLAARFGHVELVTEITKLCPELVAAENEKLETPLHEACCQGNHEVSAFLMEANPTVATKLNHESQSAFSLACRQGHLDVVKLLINQSWLMEFEEDSVESTPIYLAISRGHTDIAREILEVRPRFAGKTDKNGFSPLHYASSIGNVNMTKLLLNHNKDLALQYNKDGYTPLHLAAINGRVKILVAFLSSSPASFDRLTTYGETVFHLAVRFDKYNAFKFLAESFNTCLFHGQDQFGNTVLHLAVLRKNYQFVEYIIKETVLNIYCRNHKNQTALDILEQAGTNDDAKSLKKLFKTAGNIGSPELSPSAAEVKLTLESPIDLVKVTNSSTSMDPSMNMRLSRSCGSSPVRNIEPMLTKELLGNHTKQKPKGEEANSSEPESVEEANESPKNLERYKDLSSRHMKELKQRYKSRQEKKNEVHREALQNARNTIILVAILIATVTYTGGISPPGGVYQEGPLKGKSLVGRTKAFKIFEISNNIALFTSLSIVIILVSIIPFERKKLMRLLVITHKVMWVSISFMATAYIAATRITVPDDRGTGWVTDSLLATGAGTLGFLFLYLGVELIRHRLRKLEWRAKKLGKQSKVGVIRGRIQSHYTKFKPKNKPQSDSTNSDVDSSTSVGYHAY
ncbi:hypothetical protein WN943_022704 [Citrus x changshan-huyou]